MRAFTFQTHSIRLNLRGVRTSPFFILVAVVFLLASCRLGEASAEAHYRRFLENRTSGNTQQAWLALSTSTRQAVIQNFQKLESISGRKFSEPEIVEVFFTSQLPPSPIGEIRPLELDAKHAVLAVTTGGQTTNQHLVLEDGQWKVDWTSLIQPIVETP